MMNPSAGGGGGNNPVEAGIEMAKRAIELDSAHAYPEALQYYRRAISLLSQALQGERNEQLRATLMAKQQEYSTRVAYIEAHLPPQQQQSSGGLSFPPIPSDDPMAMLNRGSSPAPSSSSFPAGQSSYGGAFSQPLGGPPLSAGGPPGSGGFSPYPQSPQPPHSSGGPPGSGNYGSSSSALPYGAPPSTKLPPHQLIKIPSQTYLGEKAELQKALDSCEVAKKADKAECYRAALSYYEHALESFLSVLKKETNPQIKTSLRETIAVYMERAEKIKEFLLKSPDYRDPSSIPPPSSTGPSAPPASSYSGPPSGPSPYGQPQPGPSPYGIPQQAAPMYGFPYGAPTGYPMQQPMGMGPPQAGTVWDTFNSGGPGGGMGMMPGMQGMPPQQPQSFSSFDDFRSQSNVTLTDDFDDDFGFTDPASRQSSRLERADTASSLLEKPVILKVKLENSIFYPGQEVPIQVDLDNCSNRVVKFIKVSLYQRDTTYEGGRRSGKRHSVRTKIHRDEFYQGSRFPLSPYSKYEGKVVFKIPESVKPSEVSLTGAYCREYEIVVKGVVQLHTNPRVHLPITIKT